MLSQLRMADEKTQRETTHPHRTDDSSVDAAPDTEFRASAATKHLSDVVPVDSMSDVVPVESMTDVKLAESIVLTDIHLARSVTGAAPSFRLPTPPPMIPAGAPKTAAAANRAGNEAALMAMLPGAKIDDFEIV